MRITKIRIRNFRSLVDLQVQVEDYLSIIVGKNNSGKTSLLLALERFLMPNPRFEFDDFNISFQKYLESLIYPVPAEITQFCGISLRLTIEYDDFDDLSNVGNKVIMDLDPDNRRIILDFLYYLPPENLKSLQRDYLDYCQKKQNKALGAIAYLRENYGRHFKVARRSVYYDHLLDEIKEDSFVDLIKEGTRIEDIISFKIINAKRLVSNKDTERGLSNKSAKIYSAISAESSEEDFVETFKETLTSTDGKLDEIYASIFKDVIDDVRRFGGIRDGDTQIQIKSSLKHRDLLEENTTVMYGHGAEGHALPESYNGLGYLNLISIIFDIKLLINEFRRSRSPKPSDINILFIEEPEAHTHPQMQAIFIKNIKNLVGKYVSNSNGISRPLQTILSTHSAHIVAESDFDDIKYFRRGQHGTESKNLKDLKDLYLKAGHTDHYRFLKQYLTLNRSQLFFADKAILVEGDTERILLPAMIRKIDQRDAIHYWERSTNPPLPLLSQNLSIIEIGAHSHIFEIFLDFIGIKTLIITDIDSAVEKPDLDDDGNQKLNQAGDVITHLHAEPVSTATHTTNYALQFYFGKDNIITNYTGLKTCDKIVKKDHTKTNAWSQSKDGLVMCAYQIIEKDSDDAEYNARSFEDAFFHINRSFMASACAGANPTESFPSLTKRHLKSFLAGGSSFEMAANGIGKKPSFAIEILLNSHTITVSKSNDHGVKQDFTMEYHNWNTPKYIEDGLEWIKAF